MLKEPRLFGAFFITFAATSCLINKANLEGNGRTLNPFIEPCRNAGLFCVHKNKSK